ncbi:phosphatase 2C-like domain-containing protein [Scenedesmus sp. NREL 46B-D3]|nr:phosphatase 2C-like domain-containing protein [Scenedesmus sp. NREL 46B-D3]
MKNVRQSGRLSMEEHVAMMRQLNTAQGEVTAAAAVLQFCSCCGYLSLSCIQLAHHRDVLLHAQLLDHLPVPEVPEGCEPLMHIPAAQGQRNEPHLTELDDSDKFGRKAPLHRPLDCKAEGRWGAPGYLGRKHPVLQLLSPKDDPQIRMVCQQPVYRKAGMLLQAQHGTAKPVVYGVKCLQNSRSVLEDAYVAEVIPSSASPCAPSSEDSELLLFGVFDGHGGKEAALHAASSIPRNFRAALARQALDTASSSEASSITSATQNADAVLSEAWPGSAGSGSSSAEAEVGQAQELCNAATPSVQPTGSPAGAGSGSWWASSVRSMPHLSDRYSKNVRRALQSAFVEADAELAGTEVGEVVGSTAVVAVVSKTEVFVAHCGEWLLLLHRQLHGDSRAVLCRKGGAIPLTSDHKPDRSDEAARVSALGGKVVVKAGSHRVMGLLAMTRAIGDHFLRPYVIPEPEVASLQRTHEDELLILASDGLWDVFSCQEATTLALRSTMRARERGASVSAACRVGASVLARGAIERGSRDNITVLVVDLRRSAGAGSVAAVLAAQCSELVLMGGAHAAAASAAAAAEAQGRVWQGPAHQQRQQAEEGSGRPGTAAKGEPVLCTVVGGQGQAGTIVVWAPSCLAGI